VSTRAERHGLKVTRCTSCKAAITWIELDGKRIPLDASAPVYEMYPASGDNPRRLSHCYVSHFSTCPNASQHSKSGK